MDANQYVFVHGVRQTRSILERWGENPWPVLRTWLVGAVLIAGGLLGGVTLAASVLKRTTASTTPRVAGFIAGATLPLTTSTSRPPRSSSPRCPMRCSS